MSDNRRNDAWGFMPIGRAAVQRCFECGVETTGRHHVVPVSKGGTKVLPLCGVCHAIVHGGVELSPLIRAGLDKARKAGVKLGPPIKATEDVARRATELREQASAR